MLPDWDPAEVRRSESQRNNILQMWEVAKEAWGLTNVSHSKWAVSRADSSSLRTEVAGHMNSVGLTSIVVGPGKGRC